MKMKWLAFPILFLIALYLVFSPVAFSRGAGNWYALGFIQDPSGQSLWFSDEPEAPCNQSLWYTLLSFADGFDPKVLWSILSVILITTGFACTFLFARRLLKDDAKAGLAAFLTFLIVDEFAVLSTPLPRYVVLFVLAPLGMWLFLESVRKKSKRLALAAGGLFALMLAFHTLVAFFFAVSVASFVAGQFVLDSLKKSRTDWKTGLLHGFMVAVLGIGLSLPVILPSLTSALGGIQHPVYGDWARWGLDVFGLWIPDLSLVFYGKTVILKFLILLGVSLVGIHYWKNKDDAYVFLVSNLTVSFLFLFTPLGALVARLVTPGIFLEQWLWNTAPFAWLAAAGIFAARDKVKNRFGNNPMLAKAALAALLVLVLLPSALFFNGLWKNPPQSAENFLGPDAIAYFSDKQGAVVLTDIETGYLLPFLTPAKVHATTLGYIVCPTPKTLERQSVSNRLFQDPDLQTLRTWNVTHVLLNKRFWDEGLDRHFRKDGWRYPESFDASRKVFEKAGFSGREIDGGNVLMDVRKTG